MVKDLLLIIDYVENSDYEKLLFNDKNYFGNKDEIKLYLGQQHINIQNTLKYCNDNNIDVYNINYTNYIWNDNKCLKNYKLIPFLDFTKIPDFSKYETIYFGGSSLDQCVTCTRPISYLNLKHRNKILITDCCIQTTPYNNKIKKLSDISDLNKYIQNYLKNKNIKYVKSIIQ